MGPGYTLSNCARHYVGSNSDERRECLLTHGAEVLKRPPPFSTELAPVLSFPFPKFRFKLKVRRFDTSAFIQKDLTQILPNVSETYVIAAVSIFGPAVTAVREVFSNIFHVLTLLLQ